jgi:hypothetical protein
VRAAAQQVCRNCRVPTELVEDHAAGDLICKARRAARARLAVRASARVKARARALNEPVRRCPAAVCARQTGVRPRAGVARHRRVVGMALLQRLGALAPHARTHAVGGFPAVSRSASASAHKTPTTPVFPPVQRRLVYTHTTHNAR